jgi:two-component system, chemotaxis family, protein-glutamate methylesterase/glutaminase
MIRVLVVDDIAFMRIAIRRMIDAEGDMKVVGEARTGAEAVVLARNLLPDAVTMDIEMPEMNGLDATSAILANVSPPPAIVMVSATTQHGADDTIEALRRGAIDFVSKSSLFAKTDLAHIEHELRSVLRAWAGRRPVPAPPPPPPLPAAQPSGAPDLIVIGASTGGPQALGKLLRTMGRLRPPVVVALHMPPFFTASLATMLAADTGLDVREAVANETLAPGSIHIIPGGQHGILVRGLSGFRLRLEPAATEIAPSVARLFLSAASVAAAPSAVLLTGMGRDGCDGARQLRARGAPVLVQTPAECVVAGMTEAAIADGSASAVLPLDGLAAWLTEAAGQRTP